MLTIAVAGFSLAGVLAGVLIYLLVMLNRERTNVRDLDETVLSKNSLITDYAMRVEEFKRSNADLTTALGNKTVELLHEVDARKRLERYRDELLEEVARSGDAKGVALRINAELRAMQKLSARTTPADPSGDRREIVHGASAYPAVGKLPDGGK